MNSPEQTVSRQQQIEINRERKAAVRTIVGEYKSDGEVLSSLNRTFSNYSTGIIPSSYPEPQLPDETVAKYLTAVDAGIAAYAVDGERTEPSLLRKLTIGHQALVHDHWGFAHKKAFYLNYGIPSHDKADFAQAGLEALPDIIAIYGKKDPQKFRGHIASAIKYLAIDYLRKPNKDDLQNEASSFERIANPVEGIEQAQTVHELRRLLLLTPLTENQIRALCLNYGVDPKIITPSYDLGSKHDEIMDTMPDKGFSGPQIAKILKLDTQPSVSRSVSRLQRFHKIAPGKLRQPQAKKVNDLFDLL